MPNEEKWMEVYRVQTARITALEHDIERHVQIAADLATQLEAAEAKLKVYQDEVTEIAELLGDLKNDS